MYEGKDKEARKLRMTQKQYDWVQSYLRTGNASQAMRDANGGEIKPSDNLMGYNMKNNTRIMKYIQDTAEECAEIQFNEIIKNPKAPFSVRSDAIKDRLDMAGV
jgi:phage terminase small subunit